MHNIIPYDKLTKLEIPIIQTTSQTIKNFTNITKQTNNETTSHTGIYFIPCKDCNKYYICETQYNLEKRIYKHKWSIKTNDDQNDLPHVRVQIHIQFFPSHSNQTHTLQKIPKTTRICNHLQNKPYKTMSRFLSNLTIPGEHHTEQKQNQNRKWKGKEKQNIFSLCAAILLRIISFCLFISLCLLALLHPNYNLDTTI